jgi:ribosomal protein L1
VVVVVVIAVGRDEIADETADGKEGNLMDVIIGKRALMISVSEREISLMGPKGRLAQHWP